MEENAKAVNALQRENGVLKKQVADRATRIEMLEKEIKKNVIFHGMVEENDENEDKLVEKVEQMYKKVRLDEKKGNKEQKTRTVSERSPGDEGNEEFLKQLRRITNSSRRSKYE
ncbi:hypothetical protein FQA39_LY06137 [Lamprigera yunnana]|nr:hypothetical protein FQA39_LY06137 [Lamprigera yunnana]